MCWPLIRTKTRTVAKYRARMQFYGGEDPATGSAAGCAISYLVARGAVPSDARVHVRQGVEMGRPSDLFLSARKRNRRGSGMFASRAALFLWQKDSFSCRDAHAFNRYSSSQVTACVDASDFPLVSGGFSAASFACFPSFHECAAARTLPIRCRQFPGAFLGVFIGAPKRRALDREARLSLQRICAGCRRRERSHPPMDRGGRAGQTGAIRTRQEHASFRFPGQEHLDSLVPPLQRRRCVALKARPMKLKLGAIP